MNVGLFYTFLTMLTVGKTPWEGDQPAARLLPTHDNTKTDKRRQTSMPRVGSTPTTTAFEWVKIVHASDCTATVND
jgi:hypothetical protein